MSSGQLFIVSAPSGAGKTSLVKALLARHPEITVSVSHTTRAPRPGEEDGRHYHFIDAARFAAMVDGGEFLEHAEVFGNRYGTSRQSVEHSLASGSDVLLEIDWQGAAQVRELLPAARSVFILPPSRDVLLARLRGRGQDDEATIARRTAEAVAEMRHYAQADYLLINDDFETALAELASIVLAARLATARQREAHAGLIDSLLSVPPDSHTAAIV